MKKECNHVWQQSISPEYQICVKCKFPKKEVRYEEDKNRSFRDYLPGHPDNK